MESVPSLDTDGEGVQFKTFFMFEILSEKRPRVKEENVPAAIVVQSENHPYCQFLHLL